MSAGEFEGHKALIAQLQAGTLDAPGHLHRRVLSGGSVKRRRWADMSGRRRMFVVVPVAAAIAVGAALVHSAFVGSGSSHPTAAAPVVHPSHSGPAGAAGPTGPQGLTQNHASVEVNPGEPYGAKYNTASRLDSQERLVGTAGYSDFRSASKAGLTGAVGIPTNRLVHADATLEVAVANDTALAAATNRATDIVTKLGGYAQNRQFQASRDGSGSALLNLRVPIGRANAAIAALSKQLGRVVSSTIATADLQHQFAQQTNTVSRLRRAISVYQQALQSGSLTYSQRINVQIQLSNAQYQLKAMLKSRSQTVASAATADIQLTLTSNKHAFAVAVHKRGRLGRLLHNAGDFLALEGTIVLFALIVIGPIAVVLFGLWWLSRERRRRGERRLLASA